MNIIQVCLLCFFFLLSTSAEFPNQDKLINAFISIIQITEELPHEVEVNCVNAATAIKANSDLNKQDQIILILKLEQSLLKSNSDFVLNSKTVFYAKEQYPHSDFESVKSRLFIYINKVVFKES